MSNRFRPQLNTLEGRDVPASLSFQLSDGSIGSALFSTPNGVDAEESSQSLDVTDLVVTKGGVAYTTSSGAVADYASGVLVGVTATATSTGDTIALYDSMVVVTNSSTTQVATVAYDAADTQVTFALPDGTVGAISYTIPWDDVDSTEASQSVSPTGFNLNIAGRNFAYGSASFTTAPALLFEYGNLVGLSFTVDTAGIGSPYLSVSVANGVATVLDAVTGQFIAAPVEKTGSASITLDFTSVAIPAMGSVKYGLHVETDKDREGLVLVEVFAGATAEDVRDLFSTALAAKGIVVKDSGTTKLNVRGLATEGLKKI